MNRKDGNDATRKRPGKKAPRKVRRVQKQPKTRHSGPVDFPEVRGLTVERVELSAASDFPCISISFTDNTDLAFVIDPALTFQADYSRWKSGNQKVLKRWPVFRSDEM